MKTLILAASLLAVSAVAATPRTRSGTLQRRINQGGSSGSLSRGEAARLQHQQNTINRQLARDRRDGDGLSAAERAKISRQQADLGRRITQEQNDQNRRP
jgi:hypothetical protein